MIKRFFVLLAFLASLGTWAQNIEGIGDFKIGMNITEFLETPAIKVKSMRDKTKTYESPKINEILKLTSETKFEEYIAGGRIKDPSISLNKIYSPDIEKYEFIYSLGINNFTGKDEYKMAVTFFKQRLIFVGTSNGNSEIRKILVEKYGAPMVEDKSKMETCQNGYGARSEHMNGSISNYWGRGEAIEARYYFGNFSCGKYPYSGYEVYSPTDKSQVDSIQQEGRKNLESEETKAKVGGSKL